MANTDPVSGLMASMSRIRNTRPDGTAAQAGTASQAGTLLPNPKPQVQAPAMPQAQPTSFEQVLPMPETPGSAVPADTLQEPSVAPVSPVDQLGEADTPETLTRLATTIQQSEPTADLSDAYLLSLGFLYGVSKKV